MTRPRPLTRTTATRWRELGPRPWLRRGVPAVAWLLLLMAAAGMQPAKECTPAAPCGTDRLAVLVVCLCVVAAAAPLLLPLPGAAVSAVLAGGILVGTAPPGPPRIALAAAALAATAYGLAAMRHVAAARRRRLDYLDEVTAGRRVQIPDDALHLLRRNVSRLGQAAGALLLLSVAAAGGLGLLAAREADRERRAPVASAEVVGVDGEDVVTLAHAGRRHVVTVYGRYERGQAVPVYVLGDEVRLVAEPFDATFHVLGVAALALTGASLLVLRRRVRDEVAAVAGGDVPALRVRAEFDGRSVGFGARGGYDDPLLKVRTAGQPYVDAVERGMAGLTAGELDDYELDEDDVDVVAAGRLVPGGAVVLFVDGVPYPPTSLAAEQMPSRIPA